MTDIRIVTPPDLGRGFTLNPTTNKYDVALPITSHVATLLDGAKPSVSGHTNQTFRRTLYLQGSFGYIHLDFVAQGAQGDVAALPATAPTPIGLLEVQTYDGGYVYVDPNSRIIKGGNLTRGTRYIVDIIGFFNVN